MKTLTVILLLSSLAAARCYAALQTSTRTEKETLESRTGTFVAERGPHHKVIHRVSTKATSYGKTYLVTNSYTELAQNMHYQQPDGSWAESKELIEIVEGGGIARQGPARVFFSANLNTMGAIQMTAPDGRTFKSHILGLAYTDAKTGKSVLIAGIKDSIGQLIAENQVLYVDAFDSGILADVRYTCTKSSGYEQDIILRRNDLPAPEDYGMDAATVRVEVFSEFIQWAEPTVETRVLTEQTDPVLRQQMVDPDLTDQTLDFGSFRIPQGNALSLSDSPSDSFDEPIKIGKTWINLEGRQFLIEKVDLQALQPQLDKLPQAAGLDKGAAVFPSPLNGVKGAERRLPTCERLRPIKQRGLITRALSPSALLSFPAFTYRLPKQVKRRLSKPLLLFHRLEDWCSTTARLTLPL